MIASQLDAAGVPADHLCLELTESTIMSDPDRALAIMQDLRDLGVRLSVDDFGTGYSSMAYLKILPVDELKVDRSFVSQMSEHADDTMLVQSAIDLGHNLGMSVVAEGVEDRRDADRAEGPRRRHHPGLLPGPADGSGPAGRSGRQPLPRRRLVRGPIRRTLPLAGRAQRELTAPGRETSLREGDHPNGTKAQVRHRRGHDRRGGSLGVDGSPIRGRDRHRSGSGRRRGAALACSGQPHVHQPAHHRPV